MSNDNDQQDPIPVALYERFSSEMQRDGYSIAYQDRANREWCARNNAVPTVVFVDEALSASSNERPDFQRLLAECKKPPELRQGQFRAVVFFHTWRLSRSVDDAPLLTQIERAGVRLYSTTEPMDTRTASGKLLRNVSLSIGQYQLDQLSEATTEGKKERFNDGKSNASVPPFGYKRNVEISPRGEIVRKWDAPDDHAETALAAFERYAVGHSSDMDIAKWLNAHGARTTNGRPFSKDTVRVMLQNRFYAGYVPYRGMSNEYNEKGKRKRNSKKSAQWVKGEHKAIVSEELFERCQQVRLSRARHMAGRKPAESHVYLLAGLAVCSRCGRKLGSAAASSGAKENYRCKSRERGYECSAKHTHVQQLKLIPYIDDMIEQLRLRDEVIDKAVELSQSKETKDATEKQREDLVKRRNRVNTMYKLGGIDDAEYKSEIAAIKQALGTLAPVQPAEVERAAESIAGLSDSWRGMSDEEKHETLRTLLEAAIVDVDAAAIIEWRPKREFAALFAAVRM